MSEGDNFIKLRALWYKKLKDEGFNDIETFGGFIKDWPSQRIKRDYTIERIQEKQDYYRMASQFYWEHEFEDETEKSVWCLHCEGLSYREIAKELRTFKMKMNKDNVQIIINKFSKIVHSMMMREEESHE